MKLRLLAVLALCVFVAAPSAMAATTPRASFNDIEDEVMCDVCGVPLNIAEAPRADQQRREIKQLIARGETKKQVDATLVARYGPGILATPQGQGFSLAAYVIPVAAMLAALAGVAVLLPRWRRRRPPPGGDESDQPELSAADARRLDEDLARFGA